MVCGQMRTHTCKHTQRADATLATLAYHARTRTHICISMRTHTAVCGHIQQYADTYSSMRTHTAVCGHIHSLLRSYADTYTAVCGHILNVLQLLTHRSHTSHTTQQTACSECRRGWAAARVLRSASASYGRARACAALRMPALQAGRGAGPCYHVLN